MKFDPQYRIRLKDGSLADDAVILAGNGELLDLLLPRKLDLTGSAVELSSTCKDRNGTLIFENDVVYVNGRYHAIVWRGSGLYVSGTEYGLDTVWFAGGEPRIDSSIFNFYSGKPRGTVYF